MLVERSLALVTTRISGALAGNIRQGSIGRAGGTIIMPAIIMVVMIVVTVMMMMSDRSVLMDVEIAGERAGDGVARHQHDQQDSNHRPPSS